LKEINTLKINFFIRKDGTKVTITHLVMKAMAEVLKNTPDINGRIAFGKVFIKT